MSLKSLFRYNVLRVAPTDLNKITAVFGAIGTHEFVDASHRPQLGNSTESYWLGKESNGTWTLFYTKATNRSDHYITPVLENLSLEEGVAALQEKDKALKKQYGGLNRFNGFSYRESHDNDSLMAVEYALKSKQQTRSPRLQPSH